MHYINSIINLNKTQEEILIAPENGRVPNQDPKILYNYFKIPVK